MNQELLLDGEEIITESGNKLVTLTNQRIRYDDSGWGSGHLISIMLDKVSAIEVRYKSWWVLLILSALLIIYGFMMGIVRQPELMALAVIVGLLLALIYIFSRKHVITISSDDGTRINFLTKGMKRDKILDFINKIENAKKQYVKSL